MAEKREASFLHPKFKRVKGGLWILKLEEFR